MNNKPKSPKEFRSEILEEAKKNMPQRPTKVLTLSIGDKNLSEITEVRKKMYAAAGYPVEKALI